MRVRTLKRINVEINKILSNESMQMLCDNIAVEQFVVQRGPISDSSEQKNSQILFAEFHTVKFFSRSFRRLKQIR